MHFSGHLDPWYKLNCDPNKVKDLAEFCCAQVHYKCDSGFQK